MPRKPISWPLNAASRMQSRAGWSASSAGIVSSQRAWAVSRSASALEICTAGGPKWGAKRRRVKEEEAGPAPPGEDDDALVPAAARACKRTTQLPARLDKRKRLGLDESNVGIAAEQAERTANALGIGKRRIEERHALDASPCNPDMA
jgi:hypothetical protein